MEEALITKITQPEASFFRCNFIGGLWHGAFLALGMSLTQPTTVISAFVADLTGSTIWVGGLATVLTVAGALPQLFVARWMNTIVFKKPYLLGAIYLRVLSWGTLAWLIYAIGGQHPITLAWSLVGVLTVFYAGGGMANVPFTDIVGKVIPPGKRGAFFGGRGALAAPLSISAAFAAREILARVAYPNNYAMLFGLAALGLGIASLGFSVMKEPPSPVAERRIQPWREYWRQVATTSLRLKELTLAQLLTGFSLMALPFYSFVFHGLIQEDRLKVIANASRVLKPGGEFLILDYNEFDLEHSPWLVRFAFNLECPLATDFIGRDLQAILREQGFDGFRVHTYYRGYVRLLAARKAA